MIPHHLLFARRRLSLAALFAVGTIFVSSISARAEIQPGKLRHDLTVGANHDVPLKAGQVVQVMKSGGAKIVIMAQGPDGSSGVYQVDPQDVEIAAASPVPTPTPPPAPPPMTNAAPVPTTAPPPSVETSTPASPPSAPATPPTYPDDFVGGAEVTTTDGTEAAGAASVVKLADGFQAYVVSARHLLGKLGGFEHETAAADVPAFVKSIRISAFHGGDRSYSVTPLLIKSTRLDPIGGEPLDDLTIYRLNDSSPQDQAVVLSDKTPAIGETLFLIAHVAGGVPEGQRIHTMKVSDTRTWTECVFDNDAIQTSGASGAPVLNASGECVGVYSGHAKQGPHMYAFVVPSVQIISSIKNAPATPP